MQKWIIPSSMALAVSFCLFVFMASLIKQPITGSITPSGPPVVVETSLSQSKTPPIRDRKVPEPMTKKPPPPVRQVVEINDPQVTSSPKMEFNPAILGPNGTIGVSNPGDVASTMLGKPGQRVVDGDATPIVQITPQYPMDAARNGIEGWVKLSFSIDKTGSVTNIHIIDSSPKRTFDRSARKALKGWRYKAKFVGGEPMIQDNLEVRLDFTLDQ